MLCSQVMEPILHSGAQCQHLPSWALVSSADGFDPQHTYHKGAGGCLDQVWVMLYWKLVPSLLWTCVLSVSARCIKCSPALSFCWLALWCDSLMYTTSCWMLHRFCKCVCVCALGMTQPLDPSPNRRPVHTFTLTTDCRPEFNFARC